MEERVYTLGKGKLLFKAEGETNFRDLGNANDFKIAPDIEKKEHTSHRSGWNTIDDEKTFLKGGIGSFTLDDLTAENIKEFVLSNTITSVEQAAGDVVDQAVTAEHDRWIDLGKKKLSVVVVKAEDPAAWQAETEYDSGDFVSKVVANAFRYECTTAGTSGAQEPAWPTVVGTTVADGTAVWTCRKLTFAVTTDYRLDAVSGMLMPLSTGAIPDDESLEVSYSHAALTQKRFDAGTKSSIKGHLWFLGDPPAGKIIDVKGYAALSPSGELAVIGDEYINLQFESKFLTGYGYNGAFEVFERGSAT